MASCPLLGGFLAAEVPEEVAMQSPQEAPRRSLDDEPFAAEEPPRISTNAAARFAKAGRGAIGSPQILLTGSTAKNGETATTLREIRAPSHNALQGFSRCFS